MKKYIFLSTIFLIFYQITNSQVQIMTDSGWPRTMTNQGSVLTIYQPQVEEWQQNLNLSCRMAFSLQPAYGKEAVGVVYVNALTNVNMNNRMVEVYNILVTQTHFPSLDETTADDLGQLVRSFFTSNQVMIISLDRLVACTQKQQPSSRVTVNNQPPLIFVGYAPSIVLQLEGKPQLFKTNTESLQFVFNANWPLFYNKNNSQYYLFDEQEWQTSNSITGPWSFTTPLPQTLINLAKDPQWENIKSAIPAPNNQSLPTLNVYYAESPAEIILFKGQPVYQRISGTALEYATNTQSDLFQDLNLSIYYYLTQGRWFSAQNISGPWTFASSSLPADFAQIPLSSPAARVLSSVPGTDEAADAVMIAQIPTKVQVNPAAAVAQVKVTYSGSPNFQPIEGTSLFYAVNSPQKIIMISNNQYYLCYQGIWFWSSSPQVDWQTATTVPQVIYTIPVNSPCYNLTFVTQTVTTTGYIEASYTSGYMGAFVVGAGAGVVVACGTGFYNPPFFYYPPVGFPICYVGAMTYGAYAFHPYYYGGVAFGASYNPYTGNFARSATAYGPYGRASVGQAYNPRTGTYARGGTVSTPYGTRSAGHAYNPYTGGAAATRQGSNAYGQAGRSAYSNGHGGYATTGQVSTSAGTVAGGRTSNGDMYASKDGNVYKNSGGSWQKYGSGGWNSTAAHPSASSVSRPSGSDDWSHEMNSDFQDRQRGDFSSRGFGGGGWGGGGFRGGGGWRR